MKKTISLPERHVENAKHVAKETGATFSGLIRIALERFLKNVPKSSDHDQDKQKRA